MNRKSHTIAYDKWLTKKWVSETRRNIDFNLTFEEWYTWWLSNGVDMNTRGSQKHLQPKDRLEMCRLGDIGPYALNNIYCASKSINSRDARINHPRDCNGTNNSNYGNRGFKNRLSKPIQTPNGIYGSIRDAARNYGISPQGMSKRLKNHPTQYYIID